MKRGLALVGVAVAALTMTGCFMPPTLPTPASTFVQPADRPPPPSTTNHPHYDPERQCIRGYTCNNSAPSRDDEDRFLDAIAGGFWIDDLARTPEGIANGLDEAALEAGYLLCPVLEEGDGARDLAIAMATGYLSDPETFTPEMPAIFVTAAEVYLCR